MSAGTNHEKMHPVGEEAAWSESYYFNFVDPVTKLGMFTRMGFRPGDGWADALHVLYLEGSRVAFTYGRRNIENDLTVYDDDLRAGHLAITCVEPHDKWTLDYSGPAQDISDATILLERSKLRPEGWFRDAQLEMNLTFDCITEPHFTHSEDGSTGAFGHFEQSGRVTGEINLGTQSWPVNGYGVRDKSWGPRDWGAGQRDSKAASQPSFSTPVAPNPFVNWFSMNFGPDAAMGGSCFRHPDGKIRGGGWIQQHGQSMRLNDVVITTDYQADSIIHRQVVLTGKIEGGDDVNITGQVLNVCPTKVPMPGGATFINEGLTEFRWGDKTGYGIAEHWHAVKKQ
ncbi:MAG: hypothetical protein HOC70_00545 [Gammaproteobacteria bacterium]|jgi:hypothetical protein|nr:hypothetical protein [Gammaproteobacteria bacterium]MBT4491702.1 hypothetical protein [Gammaproteobacteria bacterium]MBT7371671.1 hypothetical protein [Gammaproteobacteria bacterium]